MKYTDSQNESTAPRNGNSAGAVDQNRSCNRNSGITQLFLKDPEKSILIGVTKNGRSNTALSPLLENYTLKENLFWTYLVIARTGGLVSGLIKKRYSKTGQSCYCLVTTEDAREALTKREFLQEVDRFME